MNYYIVNNASRASNYGIGTYVKQLTYALRMISDIKITIIDLCSDVREFTITTDDGIYRFQFPGTSEGNESESYCRGIYCILAQTIKEFSNAVFQFNYFQHYPLAFAIKAHFPHVRILFAVHYLGWCFDLKGNVSLFRKIINSEGEPSKKEAMVMADYSRSKKFLHLADQIIVLSAFCKKLLIEDYKISKEKIRLIYNGIAPIDQCLSGEAAKRLSPPKAGKSLLYVGRLDEIKGVDFLIKAFSKVLLKNKALHLYVVGDGNYNHLLGLCEGFWSNVTFTGRISKEVLSSIFDGVCLGVLPSFHEQCSYSAIEFMQRGIPFIGTDSTGLSEMLDCVPGFRVHIDEEHFDGEKFVDDLAMVISKAISDVGLLDLASKKMSELFSERHTLSSMSSKMNEVITNVIHLPVISVEYLFELDDVMFGYIDARPESV